MEDLEKIIEQLESENVRRYASNPITKQSLSIVENFLKTHTVMCYGGTAINNMLPKEDQFYDPETTVPDYDFYSKTPQEHAMLLANQLHAAGVASVEVKPGMHLGTFKVFADYEGVADITHLDHEIFDRLWKEDIVKGGIHYVTPNFLRMSMYLELSRPRGDVTRWKKVFTRLQLLNKHYPLTCPLKEEEAATELGEEKRQRVIQFLQSNKAVLLGITASQIHEGKTAKWYTPVTILADADTIERLKIGHSTESYPGTEILPAYTDVFDEEGDLILRAHETAACHSYHEMANGVRVASIPTCLQFVFAYMYSGIAENAITHMMCVSQRLMDLANEKESRRYALLTPVECLGTQLSLIEIKKEKAELYSKLSKDKSSPDFLKYFFSYNPKITVTQRRRVREQLARTRKVRYESSY